MPLRPYQLAAVASTMDALKRGQHPVVQSATGTGKSIIISQLISEAQSRGIKVWVLTHVQQLVQQNAAAYQIFTGNENYGIVCAGLLRADFEKPVIFATIQSIINPALRGALEEPGLIIIDEAHRIPHNVDELGQYGQLFNCYPNAARVAMTATPWRMSGGLIYGQGSNFWFDELSFVYTVPQAVADGWLSPIVGVETTTQLALEGLTVNGDYNNTEVSERQTDEWMIDVARSLITLTATRHHIAVYCPTIVSAMKAAQVIAQVTGYTTGVITGGMHKDARRDMMIDFKTGVVRVLCSVDTLTTGFDFPALDCLVCLRPTTSSSLWVQIMGRLTRLHPGKKNGLVLDYVGNLQRLGGVDTLDTYVRQGKPLEKLEAMPRKPKEPRRVRPGVRALVAIDPLSGEQARDGSLLEVSVHSVSSVAIPTRRNPNQPALLVTYACTTNEGARIDASLFLNTEQPNADTELFFYNRKLAVNLPSPARNLGWQLKGAAQPTHVIVRKAGRYWNVTYEQFPQN